MRQTSGVLAIAILGALVGSPPPRPLAAGPQTSSPLVERLWPNIRAITCRAGDGSVCEVSLEPWTDPGEPPPGAASEVFLDASEVNALMPEIAPAKRTGANRGSGYSAEFSSIEILHEEYEHAWISKKLLNGQLLSVTVHWLDVDCDCGKGVR